MDCDPATGSVARPVTNPERSSERRGRCSRGFPGLIKAGSFYLIKAIMSDV